MRKRDKKLLLEIETLVSKEKSSKELVALERGFYRNIRDEMKSMKVRALELSDAGKLEEAWAISSELKKIEDALKILTVHRLRKILMSIAWKKSDLKNMSPEEIQLYTDVRQAVDIFEDKVFGREEIERAPAEPVASEEVENNAVATSESEATTSEVESEEEAKPQELPDTQFSNMPEILVRVKAHVRFALPGDVEYNLRKEDVLYLPEKVYKILARTDKVEKIRIS